MKALISSEYALLNKMLHEERADYGAAGAKNAKEISAFAKNNGLRTILDYGCGKGRFKNALIELAPDLKVLEFDPAIPGKDEFPTEKPDLVTVLDVMEHIEPEYLEAVLSTMQSSGAQVVYMTISTEPATKNLPDGRNAHILIQSTEWWMDQLSHFFRAVHTQATQGHLIYIGVPLPVRGS